MAIDYQALKDELDAGHPDEGAYSLTDSVAAEQLNGTGLYTTWLRPAPGAVADMVRYLSTTDNRTNEGGDINATLIFGRLKKVAEAEPYTDPFNRAGVFEAGGSGANEQIALSAAGNTITFGSAHNISILDAKDAIRLEGTSNDDGVQQIVSISLQVVTVTNINVTETLERVARVYKIQDAKLLTNEQIQNAKGILGLLTAPSVDNVAFENTEINLAFADMETAGVWKSTDTAALKALSEDQQSRAQELDFGVVTESDVEHARGLV